MYVCCSTLASNVLASDHWYAGMHVAATAVNAVGIRIVHHAPIAKVRYACVLEMRVIGGTLLVVAITVTRFDRATACTGQDRVSTASMVCRSGHPVHAPIALV